MNSFTKQIRIKADVRRVFSAYVDNINEWWPRQGKHNRYSFAPEGSEPKDILFEPKMGGRYYEVFSDGSEYEIGRISSYDPPNKVAYSWKGPDWPGDSQIEVTFEQSGAETLLSLTHSGFEIFEETDIAKGYEMGTEEVLDFFEKWFAEQAARV